MSLAEEKIDNSISYGEHDDSFSCGKYMYNDPTDPAGRRTKQPDEKMREYIDEQRDKYKESEDEKEKKLLPEFLQGSILSGSFYRNLADEYLLPKTHTDSREEYDYCMVLPANESGTGMYVCTCVSL